MSSQDASLWQALNSFSALASMASTSVSDDGSLGVAAASLLSTFGWPRILDAFRWALEGGAEPLVLLGVAAVGALLRSPSALASLQDAGPFIVAALASGEPRVRTLATRLLRDIARGTLAAPGIDRTSLLIDGAPVLDALAEVLGDVDAGVAALAGDALAALGGAGGALPNELGSRALASALAARLGAADKQHIAYIRVLGVAARIAGAGELSASAIDDAGLLRALSEAISDTSDPLIQICAIEALEPLGASPRGFLALARSGGVDALLELSGVEEEEEEEEGKNTDEDEDEGDDSSNLLIRGAALAALAALLEGICIAQGPHARAADTLRIRFIPGLLLISARATARAEIAPTRAALFLDALARAAAADADTLDKLLDTASLGPQGALGSWLELCTSSAPEIRLAALGALARVLRAQSAAVANATTVTMVVDSEKDEKKKSAEEEGSKLLLTQARGTRAIALLAALGKSCRGDATEATLVLFAAAASRGPSSSDDNAAADPATAARWAAFDALAALASLRGSPDGLQAVFTSNGAESLLLNLPNSGASKAAREWRHAVLAAAAANPIAREALGEALFVRVVTAAARGPHAIDILGPQVATESRAT